MVYPFGTYAAASGRAFDELSIDGHGWLQEVALGVALPAWVATDGGLVVPTVGGRRASTTGCPLEGAVYYSKGNYEAFARPRKPEGVDQKSPYLVGGGLASSAAAAFLIRDGQMAGTVKVFPASERDETMAWAAE